MPEKHRATGGTLLAGIVMVLALAWPAAGRGGEHPRAFLDRGEIAAVQVKVAAGEEPCEEEPLEEEGEPDDLSDFDEE